MLDFRSRSRPRLSPAAPSRVDQDDRQGAQKQQAVAPLRVGNPQKTEIVYLYCFSLAPQLVSTYTAVIVKPKTGLFLLLDVIGEFINNFLCLQPL